MLLYKNFVNYDYEFIYTTTVKHIYLRSFKKRFSLGLLEIELYFKFFSLYKIELLSLELINHLALMKYLFKDCKFRVKNLKSKFIRGFHYYRFQYFSLVNDKVNKLKFFNLLNNILFKVIRQSNIDSYYFNNNIVLVLKDLSFFANLKLGHVFYLNNVEDRLQIRLSFDKVSLLQLRHLLKLFKL